MKYFSATFGIILLKKPSHCDVFPLLHVFVFHSPFSFLDCYFDYFIILSFAYELRDPRAWHFVFIRRCLKIIFNIFGLLQNLSLLTKLILSIFVIRLIKFIFQNALSVGTILSEIHEYLLFKICLNILLQVSASIFPTLFHSEGGWYYKMTYF